MRSGSGMASGGPANWRTILVTRWCAICRRASSRSAGGALRTRGTPAASAWSGRAASCWWYAWARATARS
eukprot:3739454-Alexandrium_andersonii.AAC.1